MGRNLPIQSHHSPGSASLTHSRVVNQPTPLPMMYLAFTLLIALALSAMLHRRRRVVRRHRQVQQLEKLWQLDCEDRVW
ncbi:MAG: hypothetical protein VKK04_16295 [Synechococcales bacterium]|nr:hypothetical protein [Synechococcales bacterium]